jgi:hypothetical protein
LTYRTRIAAASLIVGPLLMTTGDLFHPEESMDTTEQIAILAGQASRWYAAHLLLFIGILSAIPGVLALASVTAERNQVAGYVARIFVLTGVAAFASIFVAEMLIGRFVTDGAGASAATTLWDTMMSGPMVGAVGPGALAFFAGIAVMASTLVKIGGTWRWVAAFYSVGALLILVEILSAQVILSQIGNFLILCGGAVAARLIRSAPC